MCFTHRSHVVLHHSLIDQLNDRYPKIEQNKNDWKNRLFTSICCEVDETIIFDEVTLVTKVVSIVVDEVRVVVVVVCLAFLRLA